MNLFEINYLDKMSKLLKEAFKFKKYKAMPAAVAVFAGILMIPVVLASFAVTAIMALLSFVFEVITAPVKFLHVAVNYEGKEVKHATQFILYFISWPFIFLYYIVASMLLLLIVPTYALLSILLYVWSFGGFKFHIFMPNTDDISITVERTKYYFVIPMVYMIVGYIVTVIAPTILWLVNYVHYAYEAWVIADAWTLFFLTGILPIFIGAHFLFSTVYSLICSPYPKANKCLPVVEEEEVAPVVEEDELVLDEVSDLVIDETATVDIDVE